MGLPTKSAKDSCKAVLVDFEKALPVVLGVLTPSKARVSIPRLYSSNKHLES